jgi:hypothetical protein
MDLGRFVGSGRLIAGVPAVAALVSAALAAGGPAAAAAHAGGRGVGHRAVAGIISTIAGGIGGPDPATNVAIDPRGIAVANGHLYIADSSSVRRHPNSGAVRVMSSASSQLTVFAGTHMAGALGDGGPATSASMGPGALAEDHSGNLVISDIGHDRIRVVAGSTGTFYGQAMTAGDIYTVAGDGQFGFSGDGGPATGAELSGVNGVAVDASGNLVLADTSNQRIRVVALKTGTFYGQAMKAGDIYTVAGDGQFGFSGDGSPATAAELGNPEGVTADAAGNLVFADSGNARVRVVAARTGTFYGQKMKAGDIYTVAGDGSEVFSGDGVPATSTAVLPSGVAMDAAGNLVIADGLHRVRVVAAHTGTFYGQKMTAHDIYTVAGDGNGGPGGGGGPATSAGVSPQQVAVDAAGNLVISDRHNLVWAVAARAGAFYGKTMTAGHIYEVAGNGDPHGFSGDGGPATSAELQGPVGVAADAHGNLLFSDVPNARVRMIAARAGTFFGQTMTAGNIYTIAGNGHFGYSGDGGPATHARLSGLAFVAADHTGNLVIADADNDRIRVVAESTGTFYGQPMKAGDIYTVAGDGTEGFSGDFGPATSAELHFPRGVAVDADGNLLIADAANSRVRVVAAHTGKFYGLAMTAGDIYTIAGDGGTGFSGDGGPATLAEVGPGAVAVDAAGNVVIADTSNNRLRVVAESAGTFYGRKMKANDIYTVAGDGNRTFSGDGGPAIKAGLFPGTVAVDAAGNLVVADAANERVRVVAESTGTFYGVPMTAGDIYTVAGTGKRGFSGDGGPATKAALSDPEAAAVDPAGNLVIADFGNARLRAVTG